MSTTNVHWLRRVGFYEGWSYLLLLGVAMPLKYLADQPLAVSIVGSAHGALFIAYIYFLLVVYREQKWSFQKLFMGGVASVLPFGPFVFDRYIYPVDAKTGS